MSWGQIKYALNHTLGTDYFSSLSELILNQKMLQASDTVYTNLLDIDNYRTENTITSGKIQMLTSGSLKIECSTKNYDSRYTITVDIYNNNNKVKTLTKNDTASIVSDVITFDMGDILHVVVSSSKLDPSYIAYNFGDVKINILGTVVESVSRFI